MQGIEKLLEWFDVKYFWVYVTEKCNLSCDYCFYRGRGSETIGSGMVKSLLDIMPGNSGTEFLISGGEALMEWETSRKIVEMIREKFSRNLVTIQTNATLLDDGKLSFLNDMDVGLELGLDGTPASTSRHRKGIDKHYERLLDKIKRVLREGIRTSTTMTVHPEESARVAENFGHLLSMGLSNIDVTPAIFESWGEREAGNFIKGYSELTRAEVEEKRYSSVSREYDKPLPGPCIDLNLLPDGRVLPNWVYLSLPDKMKSGHAIAFADEQRVRASGKALGEVVPMYEKFFAGQNTTYRELNAMNGQGIYRHVNEVLSERDYRNYLKVCGFMKELNQRVLGIENLGGIS